MPTNPSEHFTLEEMIISEAAAERYQQHARTQEIQNLTELCQFMLEPIRTRVDSPIIVTSGYPCERLNSLIGGATDSQHKIGEAADIICPRFSQQELFQLIRQSNLPFDQLIDEFGSWVHASYKQPVQNRREILSARKVDGVTRYDKL